MLRALAIACCALSGCVAQSADLGENAQAIVGGTSDTVDPSVITLYGADGTNAFLCTASVIAPRVLLTAAHCVSDSLHSPGTKYYAFLGTDFNQAKPADLKVASEVHANPMWNQNDLIAGHDVGIVILVEPLSLAPLPIRRVPLEISDIGGMLRLVGYGTTDPTTGAGTGIKRQTTTALDDFDAATITYNDTMHLTCNGDSGGPAFLSRNGSEEIVGLTSFGDTKCTMFGVDTRVDAELAFVDGYVTEAMTPPPSSGPDGGTGGTDDAGSNAHAANSAPVGDMGDAQPGVLQDGSYQHGACAMTDGTASDGITVVLLALVLVVFRRRAVSIAHAPSNL